MKVLYLVLSCKECYKTNTVLGTKNIKPCLVSLYQKGCIFSTLKIFDLIVVYDWRRMEHWHSDSY